jgi:hypothetical protein
MSTMMCAAAMFEKIRAAIPGSSRTPAMLSFAWCLSRLIPRTTTSSMLGVSSLAIVPRRLVKLDRTSNSTPNFLANSTARDCITFAPLPAISSISS